MFIKPASFKKMLREAVKSFDGLKIYNDGKGYYFTGPCWRMYVKAGCIPNKHLAAIIEYMGMLPEYRCTICSGKENQNAMDFCYDSIANIDKAEPLTDTRIQVYTFRGDEWKRVLKGKELHCVINWYIEQIESGEREKTESEIIGPVGGRYEAMYYTSEMILMILYGCFDEGQEKQLEGV